MEALLGNHSKCAVVVVSLPRPQPGGGMAAMRKRAQTFFKAVRMAMRVERSLVLVLAPMPPPFFFPPMNRAVLWVHLVKRN